jgi:membrane protein DedA with SNARE-associated domain
MHWARFLAFNAIGAALWVGLWCSVGYFSGNHITSIYNTATHYSLIFGIVVGVLILAYIAFRVRKARHERGGRAESDNPSA